MLWSVSQAVTITGDIISGMKRSKARIIPERLRVRIMAELTMKILSWRSVPVTLRSAARMNLNIRDSILLLNEVKTGPIIMSLIGQLATIPPYITLIISIIASSLRSLTLMASM